jgi:hypothetical protein
MKRQVFHNRVLSLTQSVIGPLVLVVLSACGSNAENDLPKLTESPVLQGSQYPMEFLNDSKVLKEVGSTMADTNSKTTGEIQTKLLPAVVPEKLNLGSGSEAEAKRVARQNAKSSPAPKRYLLGYNRTISRSDFNKSSTSAWTWHATANGGTTASLVVDAGDAKAMRLGFLIDSIPDDAMLVVSAPGATKGQVVTGSTINQALLVNKESGNTSDSARTYWLPTVEGSVSQIQIVLPKQLRPEDIKVSLVKVAHQLETLKSAYQSGIPTKISGSCNVDVACTSPLPAEANSVALMAFVDEVGPAVCTGTLLNDSGSTKLPYFITTEHCISTQTAATTLETLWFYRTTDCGGSTFETATLMSGAYAGARLLYSESWLTSTDTTFLLLNKSAPTGAHHAAWSAEPLVDPHVTGLHHPQGDAMKRSVGVAMINNDTDIKVTWISGTTEGGSSGSGLFNSNNKYVGNLAGGYSSCTNTSGLDYYGRFDYAYNNGLKAWLNTKNSTLVPVKTRMLGDFNGDGKADILWRTADGLVNIALMNGGAYTTWKNIGKFPSNLAIMGVGDFNGDTISDIVWRNMTTGAVSITIMNGSAQISTTLSVGVTPIALNVALEGIGDFDGNGRADMLWRNTTTGRSVLSYHQTDGSVASWPVVSNYIDPIRTTAYRVGDINGDGKDDIVWRNAVTGNVVISLMNGAIPTWISITATPIPPTTVIEAVADFDGNGRADILWRNTLTGRSLMSYHNIDGSVASWPIVSNNIATTVSALGAGDFNGDGMADIVWRNLNTGNTVVSLMNGNVPTWITLPL